MARHKKRFKTPQEPYAPPPNWGGGPFVWSAGVDLVEKVNSPPPKAHLLHIIRDILDKLVEKGYNAALDEYNKKGKPLFPGPPMTALWCMPRLEAKRPKHVGHSKVVQEATWHRVCRHPLHSDVPPPGIALFLLLVTPEAHPRIRRCNDKECRRYFWARYLQRTKYCSQRCRSRSTVSLSRERRRTR